MHNLVKGIEKTMVKIGLSDEIISQFDFSGKNGNSPEDTMMLINQMDELLSKEQCLSIMEQQGCCTTGKPAKAHSDFGKKYANKTIQERIELFDKLETPHKPPCKLNEDGTLSVFWGFGNEGDYECVCGFTKKLTQPITVSKTYCGCCGGHARKILQKSLGVRLRLNKIVSSAISSKGKKSCEFLFLVDTKNK
jgi:bacterioferritin-associated ferredoxin